MSRAAPVFPGRLVFFASHLRRRGIRRPDVARVPPSPGSQDRDPGRLVAPEQGRLRSPVMLRLSSFERLAERKLPDRRWTAGL